MFLKKPQQKRWKNHFIYEKIKRITFAENFEYFMYTIVEYLVFVSDCAAAYMDADKTNGKRTKNNKE
jgi:hypothetical protein